MIVNFFSDFCYPGGLSIHQGEVALILNEKYNVDIRICIPWPLRYDMKSHKDLIENCENLEKLYKPLRFIRKIESEQDLETAIREADINHFHGTFTTEREFLQNAIQKSPKEKSVYTFHSESPNPKQNSNIVKVRKNILKMSKIFAVSQRVKESVSRVYNNDITITQNAPFRPEKHIDSSKTEILFMGRLNESKGIKNVIKMLQILDLKNAHFTIHGGAEFDSEYQDKIEELSDASDNIDLISEPLPRSEIIQLFRKADIFYFPSRLEGGPLVVLEALSAGCAVVTTPVGMVPQIIKEGFNGFICEFDDIEKQKQILQNLINDRSLLNKIKRNTLKTILPTWDETAGIIYGEYKELMRI